MSSDGVLIEAENALREVCDELVASQAKALATIMAVVKQIHAHESAGGQSVTAFSQRDERWSGLALGNGQATIGQAGCLVACAASVLCDAGYTIDPAQLNTWLKANGGFLQLNLFVWMAINVLGVVRFAELVYVPGPLGATADKVRAVLERGGFAVAQVDYSPGGTFEQHWVRLVSLDEQNALIMDPMELPGGEIRFICPKYGTTPSQAIWQVGMYERVVC